MEMVRKARDNTKESISFEMLSCCFMKMEFIESSIGSVLVGSDGRWLHAEPS